MAQSDGKTLLANTLKHAEEHNKTNEVQDMWRQHEKINGDKSQVQDQVQDNGVDQAVPEQEPDTDRVDVPAAIPVEASSDVPKPTEDEPLTAPRDRDARSHSRSRSRDRDRHDRGHRRRTRSRSRDRGGGGSRRGGRPFVEQRMRRSGSRERGPVERVRSGSRERGPRSRSGSRDRVRKQRSRSREREVRRRRSRSLSKGRRRSRDRDDNRNRERNRRDEYRGRDRIRDRRRSRSPRRRRASIEQSDRPDRRRRRSPFREEKRGVSKEASTAAADKQEARETGSGDEVQQGDGEQEGKSGSPEADSRQSNKRAWRLDHQLPHAHMDERDRDRKAVPVHVQKCIIAAAEADTDKWGHGGFDELQKEPTPPAQAHKPYGVFGRRSLGDRNDDRAGRGTAVGIGRLRMDNVGSRNLRTGDLRNRIGNRGGAPFAAGRDERPGASAKPDGGLVSKSAARERDQERGKRMRSDDKQGLQARDREHRRRDERQSRDITTGGEATSASARKSLSSLPDIEAAELNADKSGVIELENFRISVDRRTAGSLGRASGKGRSAIIDIDEVQQRSIGDSVSVLRGTDKRGRLVLNSIQDMQRLENDSLVIPESDDEGETDKAREEKIAHMELLAKQAMEAASKDRETLRRARAARERMRQKTKEADDRKMRQEAEQKLAEAKAAVAEEQRAREEALRAKRLTREAQHKQRVSRRARSPSPPPPRRKKFTEEVTSRKPDKSRREDPAKTREREALLKRLRETAAKAAESETSSESEGKSDSDGVESDRKSADVELSESEEDSPTKQMEVPAVESLNPLRAGVTGGPKPALLQALELNAQRKMNPLAPLAPPAVTLTAPSHAAIPMPTLPPPYVPTRIEPALAKAAKMKAKAAKEKKKHKKEKKKNKKEKKRKEKKRRRRPLTPTSSSSDSDESTPPPPKRRKR